MKTYNILNICLTALAAVMVTVCISSHHVHAAGQGGGIVTGSPQQPHNPDGGVNPDPVPGS